MIFAVIEDFPAQKNTLCVRYKMFCYWKVFKVPFVFFLFQSIFSM